MEPLLRSLGGLTPRRVPEAYVRAEVASFPLASKVAFQDGLTRLTPSLDDAEGRTAHLWHECEKALSEHASGWSLDRLIALRDFFWFGDRSSDAAPQRSGSVTLRRYLRHLAQIHLERRHGVTEIAQREEANGFDAVNHYRWLTFALPEDLLLVATGVEPPPVRVEIEPPLMFRRLIDQGVAEIHHHLGAGMSFQLLWASLLVALADPSLDPNALMSPGLLFDKSETTLGWLLVAAVVRAFLAEFLLRRAKNPRQPLFDFVANLGSSSSGRWRPQQRRVLEQALVALGHGWPDELPDFYLLRSLYQEIHPDALRIAGDPPRTLDEVWQRCDPIAARLGLTTANAGEQWFVLNGLRRLEELERGRDEEADEPFARLFWQVVRLRCICYRAVVQRPMTAGLQWFIRFYERLKPFRTALSRVSAEVSYRVAGGGQPIAALEVRTTPGETPFAAAQELSDLLESWWHVLEQQGGAARTRDLELGAVLHFVKARDPQRQWVSGNPPAQGMGTHAEPEPGYRFRPGGRFSDFFVAQSRRALSTADLLEAVPSLLWLVRGIDVASDELSVPTWVLVPLYRYVERQAARAAASFSEHELPLLRTTAHVGEDYRHLMEGLRRIFECVRYLLRRSGGRLGHATALGVEPRLWAETAGSLMMPTEERLWDLVFEWRLYNQHRIAPELRAEAPAARVGAIQNQIRQLSDGVFAFSCEPHELAEAHHVLHQLWCEPVSPQVEDLGLGLDVFTRALRRLDPDHIRGYEKVKKILEDYRENEAVYRRGQELVDIVLDESEVASLQAVQAALRRGVAERGILVEVNPSSNLLIGNMLDLRNHPTLRLFPPEPREGAPPPVPIAVGSDDPITFSTFLLREYSLLYEAGLAAGYSERAVHDWLATIRQTGMDGRFTVPWKPSAAQMTKSLMEDLDGYLQRSLRGRQAKPWRGAASSTANLR